jgi:hypothetical protein
MRLPRITTIHTMEFMLKSGITFTAEFTDFELDSTVEGVTRMKYTTPKFALMHITFADISVVRQIAQRRVIRWRIADKR